MELFWKWIKPKVYGFSALGGITELVSRFRKLVWHYNRGKLHHPIKFNFKAYEKFIIVIYVYMFRLILLNNKQFIKNQNTICKRAQVVQNNLQ